MCSPRETYLACYFPSLGLRVTRGFGQEVGTFFLSDISIKGFIGLEREVTMVSLIQIGTVGTLWGSSGQWQLFRDCHVTNLSWEDATPTYPLIPQGLRQTRVE